MTYLEAIMSGTLGEPNSVNSAPIFGYLDSQRDVIEPALNDIFNAAVEDVDLESEGYLEELIEHLVFRFGCAVMENKKEITNHVVNMLNLEYHPDEIPDTPKLVRVK